MGNEAYKKLEFTKAHEHYDKALLYDPKDAMLHCNKAAVFMSQNNLDMAKVGCALALKTAENDASRFTKKDRAK